MAASCKAHLRPWGLPGARGSAPSPAVREKGVQRRFSRPNPGYRRFALRSQGGSPGSYTRSIPSGSAWSPTTPKGCKWGLFKVPGLRFEVPLITRLLPGCRHSYLKVPCKWNTARMMPDPSNVYKQNQTATPQEPHPCQRSQRDRTSIAKPKPPHPCQRSQRDQTSITKPKPPHPCQRSQRDQTSIAKPQTPHPCQRSQRDRTSIAKPKPPPPASDPNGIEHY